MDSNETIRPLTEAPAQEKPEALVATSTIVEESDVTIISLKTKEEVIERLQEISQQEEIANKSVLDSIKQTFYRLRNAEVEMARKSFEENGGNPEEFISPKDELEEQFKDIMSSIREKRNAIKAEEEQEKQANLEKKLAIIERMKGLTESSEEANKAYNEFKKLQTEWNEIKNVPATQINELWKSYQLYAEKFYDLIKLNNEFREYDFKKNQEIKIHLCESAEKLAEEEDVISAFHQLQKLHQEFRETGPVAKEQREEIWARFKAASTIINKRHQQHFENIKEKEQRNLDEKTVICEIVESMEYDKIQTFQEWHDKTEEILALQAKWKTIGFAPQKMNTKIFERFRAACDEFFKRKSEHFKSLKVNMSENLERKKQMCEKAESLKDSTDWKETAEILAKLQKEWKEIGPIAKKHSETIWKRFVSACDYFYEQKNKAESSTKVVELENLEKKKAILNKLAEYNEMDADSINAETIKQLTKEWNAIGHVPFKDKDRIYKQYRTLVDSLFNKLNISASQKKLKNFKSNISNKENNIYREREKLVRAYENMKNEIQTYENNLGFLNSASKKGNSLVQEMNRKVEKLKADLELILKKIEVIDESIKK
ncbi:MAG: DUF349 domain-containing protein [Bacteroidaceae bacterium]|nr:DUF349 domain-containing protein [Bacteroidaceae bacterium]